jgi:hypothetical protein
MDDDLKSRGLRLFENAIPVFSNYTMKDWRLGCPQDFWHVNRETDLGSDYSVCTRPGAVSGAKYLQLGTTNTETVANNAVMWCYSPEGR